jgi:endogenous inhibitor of DNA gyrase (YacG/DUF329 family)
MGSTLNAHCECGFQSQGLRLGAGMMTCGHTYLSPCLCRSCRDIFSGNTMRTPVHCPECGREGEVYEGFGSPRFSLQQPKPHPEKAECPQCGRCSLEFTSGQWLWD